MIECPVCGKETYKEYSGEYDIGENPKQLSPDTGQCSECGFHYSQHINHSMEEQIAKFKETIP